MDAKGGCCRLVRLQCPRVQVGEGKSVITTLGLFGVPCEHLLAPPLPHAAAWGCIKQAIGSWLRLPGQVGMFPISCWLYSYVINCLGEGMHLT